MTTPCYGKSALFESTDLVDHHEAAALCAVCPAIAACRELLREVRLESHPRGMPTGTWAGLLLRAGHHQRRKAA